MKRHKVTINWHGELHTFWRSTDTTDKALRFACAKLAKAVGYSFKYVYQWVTDEGHNRWEVK